MMVKEKITIKDRVEDCFNSLQGLEKVPATPRNASILNGVFEQLRIIYKELEDMKDGRAENGPAADPE